MTADSLATLPVVVVGAIVAVIAVALLLIWALTRDRGVSRTSFGFYVERRRYDDDEPIEVWPRRDDTAELPPR